MSVVETRPPAAEASALPGRRLAEARAAQNLSRADVARQLKLSVGQVEALESGLYQQLPGPIFVRGFIRNYARLVKLDPNELVGALGDSVPQSAARPEAPPSPDIPFPAQRRLPWAALGACAATLVAVLAVYEFYWNAPDVPATPAPAATAPQAPKAAPKPGGDTVGFEPGAPVAVEAKPEGAAASRTPAARRGRDAQPTAIASAAGETAEPPLKRGERQVKLAFNQECWVEIRDRNERIIFSQLNHPGTQQAVTGLPPFSVVVGNALGVRLTYEDKPVDLAPHTKIDVARLILP